MSSFPVLWLVVFGVLPDGKTFGISVTKLVDQRFPLTDFCSPCSRCSIFCVAIFSWSLAAADNLKCGRFDAINAEYCSLNRGAYSAKNRCSIKFSNVGRCFWQASFDRIDSNRFSNKRKTDILMTKSNRFQRLTQTFRTFDGLTCYGFL